MPDALRVLLVEDEPDCAWSLAALVRTWGHQAEVAGDGRAALGASWRRPPDVVLLDIGLPDMYGYEVARRLREQQHSRPPLVVAVTGRGGEEGRLASRYAGIDLHMVKPVSPVALRALLEGYAAGVTAALEQD